MSAFDENNYTLDALLFSYGNNVSEVSAYYTIALKTSTALFMAKTNATDVERNALERIGFTEGDIDNCHLFDESIDELQLTYEVTLFDNFLNSITRYVLYHFASHTLGNASVEARELLAKNPAAIIKSVLDKKADQLSRDSFLQRFTKLREITKQPIVFDSKDVESLKALVKTRNAITHDSRSHTMTLDNENRVVIGKFPSLTKAERQQSAKCLQRMAPVLFRAVAVATGYQLDAGDETYLQSLERVTG